eukprot:11193095-Alexandrium_andersonii.AAC.1
MSASLVGSEMCIRDRPSHWHLASESHQAQSLPFFRCVVFDPGVRRGRDCLLYTSDAADDM